MFVRLNILILLNFIYYTVYIFSIDKISLERKVRIKIALDRLNVETSINRDRNVTFSSSTLTAYCRSC